MPKKTVEQIVDSGNHYVIQVKRNQPSLFSAIECAILTQTPLDSYDEQEKGHGRHSRWTVNVYNAAQDQKANEWKNLRRFIHVHKHTIKKNEESHADRFYISDQFTTDAKFFHQGIRGHWKIENSLHWVKDVVHGEDQNGIRTANGPLNTAVFSAIAINIHRKNGHYSITDGQLYFSDKIKELFEIIMK